MRISILYCRECNKYTMSRLCTSCSTETSNPLPPRFSPQDKYGKYRRMLRGK